MALSRDNFNLDNSFVILLKDRVTLMEQLTIVMIRWFIINTLLAILSIAIGIVGAIVSLQMILVVCIIFAVNIYNYIQAIRYIYQPEKERLHDIVHNDFYITHKVNSEILLQDIQAADRRMGQISMIITSVKATIIFNLATSIALVIIIALIIK